MDYLNTIKKIKALAETGLVYAQNGYEVERNQELVDLSKELMAAIANKPIEAIDKFYLPPKEYPTPKVDVRALILNEKDEVLLAKEMMDGKWSIPGGWADIGHSPSEVVVKEVKEETGLESKVERVLAIYDKRCHPHPPQPWYVYKIMFLCKSTGGELRGNFDIEEANWFALDKLPPLSEDRILKSQIKELYQLAKHPELPIVCD
ncbi:NUDIX hydrolase N-terminal domain-containing protein [Carboxylicivirga marina]|uniref:NUDIX hydrolase N-terminal domain-containing protein n=1 Tax=Carboxylicivirga marina TaxID=2800988 RepID=A0ABS1HLU9_9BACT|nr:NUDIX hydrolase N-terminal domain-containing protein [Carboxylicivirga marina]MBK3518633.1 NUDIX hydrolase N-terminal domain-containing protein [Carboxylicivirga marina]